MSTVVHHGLHSRLDSQMMEHITLKLKLSSPKLSFSQSLELSLLSSSSSTAIVVPTDSDAKKISIPYVHPSVNKHSSMWLDDKSLKMCTENLGSETGSELLDNSTAIFSASSEIKKISVQRTIIRTRQVRRFKEVPPPLTTLNGSDSLHVKAHREDGRLMLKAIRSGLSGGSCFQADRSHGRLRLSLTDSTRNSLSHSCSLKQSEQDENDE